MSKFKVTDQDNFVQGKGEELEKEDIVDRDGYRTTEQIVMEMIAAGERLEKFRREEFDIEEERDFDNVEDYEDITRSPGYDAADAAQDMRQLKDDVNRYNEAVSFAKQKEEKKEEKNPERKDGDTE